jgi:hypothetical protein
MQESYSSHHLASPGGSPDEDQEHSETRAQERKAGRAEDEVASTLHPRHQCERDKEVERDSEQCRELWRGEGQLEVDGRELGRTVARISSGTIAERSVPSTGSTIHVSQASSCMTSGQGLTIQSDSPLKNQEAIEPHLRTLR